MKHLFLITISIGFLASSLFSADDEFSLDVLKVRYRHTLEHESDVIDTRKPVPSKEKPQGELRLVSRGEARVIQTLIFSRFPSRFLKAMKKIEAIAWPIEMIGKGDSNLYMTGVELAIGYANTQYPFRKNKEDKRKKLLMELVYSPKHCFAAFYLFELDDSKDVPTVATRELFSLVPLSSQYVKREQVLILEDAFEFDREKAVKALGYTIESDSENVKNAMKDAAKKAEAAETEK